MAWDRNGREHDALSLPASRPTRCALGGRDGRTLCVMSAREGLTREETARQPDADAVFAFQLEGLPNVW